MGMIKCKRCGKKFMKRGRSVEKVCEECWLNKGKGRNLFYSYPKKNCKEVKK